MEISSVAESRREINEQTLFIKKVTIKDFLTYQDFTLDMLAPRCNLVLGKNGSGKSSFLKAIIYVLSDRYSNWTKQQKRGLLNNIAQQTSGKGSHTYWVEITLDNSQHRIPFNATAISIRKSYNCDTDREDYQINGQPISPKDLTNLLESANFMT
jgi:structural maintenance of chromosome 3 (chondroitin sulfate proteoglycan 6)